MKELSSVPGFKWEKENPDKWVAQTNPGAFSIQRIGEEFQVERLSPSIGWIRCEVKFPSFEEAEIVCSRYLGLLESEIGGKGGVSFMESVMTTKELFGVPVNFVRIPAGEFMMGSLEGGEGRGVGETRHKVRITKSFNMMTTPVTQELWEAVMGINPSYFRGSNLPVETICWGECQNFISRLNKVSNQKFRLPTEAEWEYACRAGSDSPTYGELDEIAWHNGNSGQKTHPVGMKQPNAWGLYDMLGNVWEWCQDWYGEYFGHDVIDPVGPSTGSTRVIRGGARLNSADFVRAACRDAYSPGVRDDYLGFRLVLETGEQDIPEQEQKKENTMERPIKDTEREQLRQKLLGIRDVIDDVLNIVSASSARKPGYETVFATREEARVAARLTDGHFKAQKHPESGWILVTK